MNCKISYQDDILDFIVDDIPYFKNATEDNLEEMLYNYVSENDEQTLIEELINNCSFNFLYSHLRENSVRLCSMAANSGGELQDIELNFDNFKNPQEISDMSDNFNYIGMLFEDSAPDLIICVW